MKTYLIEVLFKHDNYQEIFINQTDYLSCNSRLETLSELNVLKQIIFVNLYHLNFFYDTH